MKQKFFDSSEDEQNHNTASTEQVKQEGYLKSAIKVFRANLDPDTQHSALNASALIFHDLMNRVLDTEEIKAKYLDTKSSFYHITPEIFKQLSSNVRTILTSKITFEKELTDDHALLLFNFAFNTNITLNKQTLEQIGIKDEQLDSAQLRSNIKSLLQDEENNYDLKQTMITILEIIKKTPDDNNDDSHYHKFYL